MINNDQQLHAALHFFDEVVMLTRYEAGGVAAASYPVSLPDVAAVLSDVSLDSGVLPLRTVFWQRRAGLPRIGIYVPPRRRTVKVRPEASTVVEWTVPLPPLLWVGHGTKYRLWALRERPHPGDDPQLYVAPAPNVYATAGGGICAGSVRFPLCKASTIEVALAMFFASEFNTHLSDGKCRSYFDTSVLTLWRDLHEQERKRFPLGELVDGGVTLSQLIEADDG